MSFLTEDADSVNTMNMETEGEFTRNELKQIFADIRELRKNAPRPEWHSRMWGVHTGEYAYWPTNPEASNWPVDDYKWAERYDHPKD